MELYQTGGAKPIKLATATARAATRRTYPAPTSTRRTLTGYMDPGATSTIRGTARTRVSPRPPSSPTPAPTRASCYSWGGEPPVGMVTMTSGTCWNQACPATRRAPDPKFCF